MIFLFMQTSNQTLDIGFKITHQGLIDLEINSSVTILFWLQIFFILKKKQKKWYFNWNTSIFFLCHTQLQEEEENNLEEMLKKNNLEYQQQSFPFMNKLIAFQFNQHGAEFNNYFKYVVWQKLRDTPYKPIISPEHTEIII